MVVRWVVRVLASGVEQQRDAELAVEPPRVAVRFAVGPWPAAASCTLASSSGNDWQRHPVSAILLTGCFRLSYARFGPSKSRQLWDCAARWLPCLKTHHLTTVPRRPTLVPNLATIWSSP